GDQQVDQVPKGRDLPFDVGVELGDGGVQVVDVGQDLPGQQGVVVGEPAGERLDQGAVLADQGAHGQVGQQVRVAVSVDQRGQDAPPGYPEDVADHHAQFDAGVFQQRL